MPPKSLVDNSILIKKPKQQDSYLGYGLTESITGSGGSSEGWAKKCPDDQGDQRGLKCRIIVKQYLVLY
jgi:hypothetical protein